jgi:hypothetical protein
MWRSKKTSWAELLAAAAERGSPRKLRLLSCAYARLMAPVVKGLDAVRLIELGERLADRRPDEPELRGWKKQYEKVCGHRRESFGLPYHGAMVLEAAIGLDPRKDVWEAEKHLSKYLIGWTDPYDDQVVPALIREVFDNPFRPLDFAPWRSRTAVALARQAYTSRDFGALPILADALQDAGCVDEEVLAHCRGGGPHVRGCWVVDGVFGKE